MTLFWLGFLTMLVLATAGATAFSIHQWVWKPWKVVRADQAALNMKFDNLQSFVQAAMSQREARALTDEEVAYREQKLNARSRSRVGV